MEEYEKKYDYEQAEDNCTADIIKVYNSRKMGIYVKNHTLKTIEMLWEMGYYYNHKSIFNEEE